MSLSSCGHPHLECSGKAFPERPSTDSSIVFSSSSVPISVSSPERQGTSLPICFASGKSQSVSVADGGETDNSLMEAIPSVCAVVSAHGQEQSALSLGVPCCPPGVDCDIIVMERSVQASAEIFCALLHEKGVISETRGSRAKKQPLTRR